MGTTLFKRDGNDMWKWTIAVLAVVGAVFGIVQAQRSVAPIPIPPLIADPVRNPYEKGIAASGLIEPASESIVIGVPDPGLVMDVFVKQNDAVKKGDKLFEIDTRALTAQRLSAEASVRKAEATVKRFEAAVSRSEAALGSANADAKRVSAFRRKEDEPGLRAKVAQADAAVLEAKNAVAESELAAAQQPITVSDSQTELARLEKTEVDGASSKQLTSRARFQLQLDKAKLETVRAAVATNTARVKNAEAAHLSAKSDLDTYLAGAWQPDVDKATAAVAEAKVAVSQAQADVADAKAGVAQAQAEVARIAVEIARRTVCAPLDSTVLRVNLRKGEYALALAPSAESAPIVLGVIDPLHVRADIDEFDAPRFKPGMSAVAMPKGIASIRIPLEYVRVDPFIIPKRALTNTQREIVDTRVLEVLFRIKKSDENKAALYVGQQVDVFIDATEKK
ncbi:MAG: biotin/lipoyl-binding protein [Planctomycetota bacterium]